MVFFYKINFKSQIFKNKLTLKKKFNMNKGLLIIFLSINDGNFCAYNVINKKVIFITGCYLMKNAHRKSPRFLRSDFTRTSILGRMFLRTQRICSLISS